MKNRGWRCQPRSGKYFLRNGIRKESRPVFAAGLPGIGVAVGGLLNVQIVPDSGIGIVLPRFHAREHVSFRLRIAAQRAVDHGDHFGALDGLLGAKRAVGVALDVGEVVVAVELMRVGVFVERLFRGLTGGMALVASRQ